MLFDGFLGQFAVAPGVDWPVGGRRWGAGQVDDLDNLFGGEGIRRTGARRVGEDGGNRRAQVRLIRFHDGEGRIGGRPASAPEEDGRGRTAEMRRDRLSALPSGGGEDNLDAADERLGRGLLAQQALQDRPLGRGHGNRHRQRARHWTVTS